MRYDKIGRVIGNLINPESKLLKEQREQFLDLIGRENLEDYLKGSKQLPDYKPISGSFQWIDRGKKGFSIFNEFGNGGYVIEPINDKLIFFDIPFLKRLKIFSKKLEITDYRLKESSLSNDFDVALTHMLGTGDDFVSLHCGAIVTSLILPWETGLPFLLAAIRITYLSGLSELYVNGCHKDITYLRDHGIDVPIDKWKCFHINQDSNIANNNFSKSSKDTELENNKSFLRYILNHIIVDQKNW